MGLSTGSYSFNQAFLCMLIPSATLLGHQALGCQVSSQLSLSPVSFPTSLLWTITLFSCNKFALLVLSSLNTSGTSSHCNDVAYYALVQFSAWPPTVWNYYLSMNIQYWRGAYGALQNQRTNLRYLVSYLRVPEKHTLGEKCAYKKVA